MANYFSRPANPTLAMTAVFRSIEEFPKLCGRVRCVGKGLSTGFSLEAGKRDSHFSDFSTLMMAAQTKPLLAYDLSELGQEHWASVLAAAQGTNRDGKASEAIMAIDAFIGDEDDTGSTANWIYYVFISFETQAAGADFGKILRTAISPSETGAQDLIFLCG